MQYLAIFTTLFLLFSSIDGIARNPLREKGLKALWNLEEMAECHLGYTALDYNNYGCWCGVGGAYEPVDDIDKCCMNHDKCYDDAINRGACFDVPFEYVEDYSWTCQANPNKNDTIHKFNCNCTEPQNACKTELCWCDRTVVDCWGGYPKPQTKAKCIHPSAKHPLRGVMNVWTASLESLRKIVSLIW